MKKGEAQLVIEHIDTVIAKFAESVAPTIASVKNIEQKISRVEEVSSKVTVIEKALKETNDDLRKVEKRVSHLEAA